MRGRLSIATLSVALLLVFGLSLAAIAGVRAQDDATPGPDSEGPRPAHIHDGSCDELGAVVVPLTDLSSPEGTSVGQDEDTSSGPQYSFTNVPLPLDAIVAANHAINVHESADNIEQYIACGNIGGVIDANGSLVIGLRELNSSGFTGIAVLTVSAIDPATTDVSVFVAEDFADEGFVEEMTGDDIQQDEAEQDEPFGGTPDSTVDLGLGTPGVDDDGELEETGDSGDDILEEGTPESGA